MRSSCVCFPTSQRINTEMNGPTPGRLRSQTTAGSPLLSLAMSFSVALTRESRNAKQRRCSLRLKPQFIVIELKRNQTPREMVAQALDYASWVQDLEPDELALWESKSNS